MSLMTGELTKRNLPLLIKIGSIFTNTINIFLNPIFNLDIKSHVLAYADDIKLFGPAGKCLQEDLNKICIWAQSNGMTINNKMCSVTSVCNASWSEKLELQIHNRPNCD